MNLPSMFLCRMKALLGEEYEHYLDCMEQPAYRAVRVNTLKCDADTLRRCLPFPLSDKPTPFSPLSFYTPANVKCGALPAHHAGMFYVQEPSAASAVTLLDPQPDEKILDLCAAPGGKSTQIAALTGDRGLLWSNEIVRSRAEILSGNIERMGIRNAIVSSCRPDVLAAALPEYFDRVLVDAPCSGEGMFRRDATAIAEWSPDSPAACADRQREILDSAAALLKPGGILVYSTCTFSREENEDTVRGFLERHSDFSPVDSDESFGRSALDGVVARRIFPMDGGEGHFAAKFLKTDGPANKAIRPFSYPRCDVTKEALTLFTDCFSDKTPDTLCRYGDTVYVLPEKLPAADGVNIVRAGYALATLVGSRLVPCHGAFLCHAANDCRRTVDFQPEDAALLSFLHGEEIAVSSDPSRTGWCAVTVAGVVTGFGKVSNGRLKNKYPKGLRLKASSSERQTGI